MLYLISLGLSLKSISIEGFEALKKCSEIYFENYTSTNNFSVEDLEKFVGRKIIPLNRKQVEVEKPFFKNAKLKNTALLVCGDALSATTHMEIINSAKRKKIKVKIFHNASIITAVAETGLSLYKFGKIASIPFWQENFNPQSFFDILEQNKKIGAHTLFLLDLRPEKKEYMSIKQAIEILLKIAKKRKSNKFTETTFCIGCSQLGTQKQTIISGAAKKLMKRKFGTPACLIVPASLSNHEAEALSCARPRD